MSSWVFWCIVATTIPGIVAFKSKDFSSVFVVCIFVLSFGLLILANRIGGDASWVLLLGAFIALIIWIGVCWFAGRVSDDIRGLLKDNVIKAVQIWVAAGKAAFYAIPAALIVWISLDVAELYERRIFYGCSSEPRSEASYYGLKTQDKIFHGSLINSNKGKPPFWASAQEKHTELFLGLIPQYFEGPVVAIVNWGHARCPAPETSYDHEKSALKTVSVIARNMEEHLIKKVTSVLNTNQKSAVDASNQVEYEIFGDVGDLCHARDQTLGSTQRVLLPANGECVLGKLPRSCGFWRWINHSGQCIERKVKRPTIQTYEDWRSSFKRSYKDKAFVINKEVNGKRQDFDKKLKQFVQDEIDDYEKEAKSTIRWSFLGWAIIGWIGIISAVSFVIKTFLTMFGRFVFSDETPGKNEAAKLSLIDNEQRKGITPILASQVKPAACHIKPDDSGFRIINLDFIDSESKWFAFDNAGVTWPKYGHAKIFFRIQDSYLRRLRYGKASTHVVQCVDEHQVAQGRVRQDMQIIEVELKPGQEVILDLRKVLAFEQNIRFKTRFLPRLGAFFQRQLFFSTAKSKNQNSKILLIGEGKAFGRITFNEPDGFVNPKSIGIMDLCGTYRGAASLKGFSPYYRPVTLGPATSETIVYASNAQEAVAIGLIARIKGFIWFLLPV